MVCNPMHSGQKHIRSPQTETYSLNQHCVPSSFLEQMVKNWFLGSQFRGSLFHAGSLGLRVRGFGIFFLLSISKLSLRSLLTQHLSPEHLPQHRLHLL